MDGCRLRHSHLEKQSPVTPQQRMNTTGTRVVVLSQLEHPFIRDLGIPGWFGHDAIGNRVRFLTARRCSLWIQFMPILLGLH